MAARVCVGVLCVLYEAVLVSPALCGCYRYRCDVLLLLLVGWWVGCWIAGC